MNPTRACPKCGAPLPADAPAGHCPHCLLALAAGAAPGPATAAALEQATLDSGTAASSGTGGTGTVRLSSPTEQPGDTIGRYKLLQKVGEGGCGTVYMAEQSEPVRRKVALKVIKLGMDTKSVIARFDAERQALAMMDHPNIAKVLDAGATDSGRPYFVMELVRGIPITKYCDENHLDTPARLDLFTAVCSALQHAHQKGIIHRDIKPSNILVTLHDGVPVPKVIDFGIAKATEARLTDLTLFTELHAFVGTPAYMSPEQAEMSGLDMDTRADIYSLGVLLYELLSGKLPFDPETLLKAGLDEMRRTIREVEPPRPSTRLSTVTGGDLTAIAKHRGTEAAKLSTLLRGDLDWIVMKALEKDRTRRYESASAFAQDIRRHLGNEAVLACPPSAAYLLQKLVRRHKLAFAASGAIAASLVIGLSVSTWLFFKEKDARERAVKAEESAVAERGKAVVDRDRARSAEKIAHEERAKSEKAEAAAKTDRDVAVAEKKRANDQAAIATAVTEFLQNDLLLQADSEEQADKGFEVRPDLTVKEALRRASDKVGLRFTNQPMVEAEIRVTLGHAFRGVGEARLAIPHMERASALHKRLLGADHRSTINSMELLAAVYSEAGRISNAISLAEEMLKLAKAKLGLDHPGTLSCMDTLASAYHDAGRIQDALTLLEEALKLTKAKFGSDQPDTIISMNNLAVAYQSAGRPKDALPLAEEALKLSKAKQGPDHPGTLACMHTLAGAYTDVGRFTDALPLYRETLKLAKVKFGIDHPQTLTCMFNLAAAYDRADQLAEAIPLYEESLKLQSVKLGPGHPETLQTKSSLSRAYHAAIRLAEVKGDVAQANAWKQKLTAFELTDVAKMPAAKLQGTALSDAQKEVCIRNLKQIQGGKQQWALQNRKSIGDMPSADEIWGLKGYVRGKPICPAGGTYAILPVGQLPRCSLHEHGHKLPEPSAPKAGGK